MSNPDFKHRNAYTINHEDNSAEFDLYDMAGNVVGTFVVDLEDVGYIANLKWCKSQYGVENHKVKNLARFIAAQYIEDLKPTQSVIRIDERKLDYRKCNLRIGVTGGASKDSASRLTTDAKKCEANGDYLHVYFARKQKRHKILSRRYCFKQSHRWKILCLKVIQRKQQFACKRIRNLYGVFV